MKQAMMLIAFALIAAVYADPVNLNKIPSADDIPSDPSADDTPSDPSTDGADQDFIVDLHKMASSIADLQQNVDKLLEHLEETARNVSKLAPHVVRHKRQTTVDGSVERGPDGSTGHLDINHRRGGTTYNGHISGGPDGTRYGGGIRHETRNGHVAGSVTRDQWGTLNRVEAGPTWNNGNTRATGFVEHHSRGGNAYGGGISHRTRNGHFSASVTRDQWGTLNRAEAGRTWNNGNTRLGGFYEQHSRGGRSGGIRFTHRF